MTWYVSKMLPPDQCTSGCQAYRENWDLEPGKVKKMHFPKLVDAKKEMFKNKAQTNMMTKISTNNLITKEKKTYFQLHLFEHWLPTAELPIIAIHPGSPSLFMVSYFDEEVINFDMLGLE